MACQMWLKDFFLTSVYYLGFIESLHGQYWLMPTANPLAVLYIRNNRTWAGPENIICTMYMVVCGVLTGARVSFRLTNVNCPGKLIDAGMSRVCAIIKLIHVRSKRPTLAYKPSPSASIRKRCNWRILNNEFYTIFTMIVSFLYM